MNETERMLRVMVRNQRLIMLTLSTMIRNEGGMASGYWADKLRGRVIDMEQAYPWIAAPSERIE